MFLLQFDEQKDHVAVEQILRVVFLDVQRPCSVSAHLFYCTQGIMFLAWNLFE